MMIISENNEQTDRGSCIALDLVWNGVQIMTVKMTMTIDCHCLA